MKRLDTRPPMVFNPGSDLARRGGCTCSMIRNFYGRGVGDERHPQFEIAPGCPLHATAGSGQSTGGAD